MKSQVRDDSYRIWDFLSDTRGYGTYLSICNRDIDRVDEIVFPQLTKTHCGRSGKQCFYRHRVDADPNPDPTFNFDADPDPDPDPELDPESLLRNQTKLIMNTFK